MSRSLARRLLVPASLRKRASRLALEQLESRDVPALFNALSAVQLSGGDNFGCVATGDFTGNGQDGLTDLVMTNQGTGVPGQGSGYGNTISILEPTGNGTFTRTSTLTVGSNVFVSYVAVGDFTGSGIEDLAVVSNTNSASGNVTIFMGNGDGGFTLGNTYATGLDNVDWVGIAPMFAGSSVPSIVVSAFGETTGGGNGVSGSGIDLYQGNGDGTFNLTTTFSDGTGFVPDACALGKFSGSSNNDIAVAEPGVPGDAGEDVDGEVEILINNGSGGLSDGNSFDSGGYYPTGIATAQFTSSGRPDLVVANAGDANTGNFSGSSIGVLINTGGDNFNESTITAGVGSNNASGVFAVATGDFLDNGHQDIAAVEYGGDPVTGYSANAALLEYAGNGQGNFTENANDPYLATNAQTGGQFLAVGSFNDSSTAGVPDVVICTADSGYDVYLNTTTASNPTTTTVTSTPSSPITAGTSIDFTATVSGSPSVGTVTFYAGPGLTNPIGSPVSVSSGTATSSADTTLPTGTDTITAVYSGGTGFAGSQGTESVIVDGPTTTTVSSTPSSPIASGTSIDFTATISGSPSVGTVTFYAGPGLTNPIGSAVNVSAGTAVSAADTTLPVGANTITAVYSGGTGFEGSQGTESVTVNAATTTTVASSPSSPITQGTSIDFTATISGSPSVGTVTFYAGPGLTNPIGSAVNVSSGTATSAADTSLPAGSTTITAVYSGGSGFAGSQGTESLEVDANTTTSVSSTPSSPITQGTSIDFTATISGNPSVGTVTFYAGPGLTNPIGSPISVSGGTATSAADTTLPVGSNTITAVYSGGTDFAGSQGTEPVTVNSNGTTTVSSTPSGPITQGTSIVFTATISGSPSVGTVTFYAGPGLTNPIGSPVNVSGGTATSAADTTLPIGSDTITAYYSGGTGFASSQGTETVVVNASTTTAVTSTPNGPITQGTSIDFIATISGSPSVGTVTFYAGPGLTNPIGSPVNVSGGSATSSADTTLPVGSDTITAVYSGGTGFAGSQGSESLEVDASTTTSVSSTPSSPITQGTSINFTATISGNPSVGTVTFYAGPGLTNPIGSPISVSGGTATSAADTTLPVGSNTITAVYSGGTNFAGSQGTEGLVVNASTTTSVSSSPTGPITQGTSIDFTATISGNPSVGTVTFYAGPGLTNPIGSPVNVSGGSATSSADTSLAVGSDTITAVYTGGTGFAGSQGTEPVTVNASSTTSVSSTPSSPITQGTSIDFTATINGSPSVGTVTFYAGPGLTNQIGSAINVLGGTATSAADTSLPVGSDTITAVYSGGTGFAGSQGTETVQVDQALAITSSASTTFTAGTSASFSLTASGYPIPTFTEFGTLPRGVTLSSAGVLSGTPGAGTGGTYSIVVVASNGVSDAFQAFNLTVDQAPAFTSSTSTTFIAGDSGSFSVAASGYPAPTFTESGSLPSGVTFSSAGVLTGTPAAGTNGNYPIVIIATNGISPDAIQAFTLTVDQAPAITSATSTTFTVGTSGSFSAAASGYPAPTFTESGPLPSGVTLSSAGVLTGTPGAGTGGTYPIVIMATNGVSPDATQSFDLAVDQAPAFTSSTSTSLTVGTLGSFSATASGYPAPTFTESGSLPSGVTLTSTGTLTGTPAAGTAGTYPIVITAANGISPSATQSFTLTIGQAASLANSFVTVSPGSVQAGDTTTLTLQAVDGYGNDLTSGGLHVSFALGSSSGGQGTITAATDNGNGKYTATFTGKIAGTNTITATINGNAVTSTAPSLTVTPGLISLSNSQLNVLLSSVQLGGETTIVLQGEDAYGNEETSGGATDINFTLQNSTGGRGTISSVTDNANGTYTATFIGTVDGTNTIEATIGGVPVTSTIPIGVTGAAVNKADSLITVSASSVQSGNGVTVTLQAESGKGVKETSGGLIVGFGLASGSGGQGTFGPVSYLGNGLYKTTFTGTTVGSNTITATIDGIKVTSKAAPIKVMVGQLSYANSLVTVSSQSVKAGSKVTVTFQPRDAAGNKLTVPGLLVSFAFGGNSTAQGSFTNPAVYRNGTYTATFTGTIAGGSTIVTTVNGATISSAPPVISVIPGSAVAAKSTLSVSEGANVVVPGTSITLTLQAVDANGNLETTGGLKVAFKLANPKGGGSGTFSKVIDNKNGTYTVTFTGTIAGPNTIEAMISGAVVASTEAITVS